MSISKGGGPTVDPKRIGAKSRKDKIIFLCVVIYCLLVTSILGLSLPNMATISPWNPSLPSFVSLTCGSVMIVVTYMWIFLGIVSLFYKPPKTDMVEVGSPLISAIIPAHNEEKVVADLVSDLLNQTYHKLEVIVVTHNCSDRTKEVLKPFKDPRLKVLELTTKESGKTFPLNYGVFHASGEIIAEFDADNRVKDPNMIEKAAKYFQDTRIDAVQARLETKNGDFNLLTKFQEFEYKIFSHLFWAGRNLLGLPCTVGGTGIFFRKKTLEKVGYWDNELTEDYSMYCKISHAKGKIIYAPDVVSWDEKPPYWSAVFKQRSRWVRGHLNLIPKRIFRWSGIMDLIYLIAPLASFAWYTSSSLILLHILSAGHINYWYPPVALWFFGTLINIMVMYGIIKRIGCKGMKRYIPLYYLFSFHWLVVFLFAFTVKSWGASKTTHGYDVSDSKNRC